ncbi:D-amino-acid dehydrogenase [Halopolyspora algeriensis]|uniref:D-amino-acid dehydrogenase n=1 Tax=Halopolyspora algeriensis TaxID=1500506 RepID=A0A368VKS1_9ACTN|nr:FAD-dependent oxidoreductase [Halopolyspora algeriensis]RCW39591.1 D-amino-acid dehydrogenase [Halopolyspora algeriensis]TQM56100.1 D-amino-acid dehydrogenase [Halopolyspora algeriensis]
MRADGIEGVPGNAVVVGAGVVGLSTAWFLQEHGVEVTVLDRADVAAGASWGNAGYLSPGLSVPLPEPGVLRYGLRSLLDRNAPLYVPATVNPGLWSFLATFARHCTTRAWERSMRSFVPMNSECLEAFDMLEAGGVRATSTRAPITAAFEKAEQLPALRHEFDLIRRAGQELDVTEMTPAQAGVPQLSSQIEAVLRLENQRYVDPGEFVRALAASVTERGGEIRTGFTAEGIDRSAGRVIVRSSTGERVSAEAAVVSAGAWLSRLAKPLGVRTRVQAGRGYSFTVPTEHPVPGPIYLPAVRVACTPYQGGLRVAGTMEFRSADAALDRDRIEAIVRSARPLLDGVSWQDRHDEWVGPRPVTPDGLPLIGASNTPGVFIAGGHGMWGLTLGPLTGHLLAEQIGSGKPPAALRPFDPLR